MYATSLPRVTKNKSAIKSIDCSKVLASNRIITYYAITRSGLNRPAPAVGGELSRVIPWNIYMVFCH